MRMGCQSINGLNPHLNPTHLNPHVNPQNCPSLHPLYPTGPISTPPQPKIHPYNFELCRFKVGAFLRRSVFACTKASCKSHQTLKVLRDENTAVCLIIVHLSWWLVFCANRKATPSLSCSRSVRCLVFTASLFCHECFVPHRPLL